MEAKVEGLAQQALGTRATLVRAVRNLLHGGPSLEAASSLPPSVSILLGAQVCHICSSTIPQHPGQIPVAMQFLLKSSTRHAISHGKALFPGHSTAPDEPVADFE